MRSYYLLALLFVSVLSIRAQDLSSVDVLMQNAEYSAALEKITVLLAQSERPTSNSELKLKKAEALIHLGKFEDAELILSELNSDDEFFKAKVETNYGLLLMNQGRHDKAVEFLTTAIDRFETLGKRESLEAAQAISHLGLVYNATGKSVQAEEQLLRTLSIREKLLPENHELIAAAYNDIGLAYAGTDNDKALDYYEKALKIYESIHGKDHEKIAIAKVNTGFIYRSLELYGDAINNFEDALRIWEKMHTGPHATKAFALSNLGDTYARMRNYKASKGYYEKALTMYRDSYGSQHPDIAQVLNSMGNLEVSEGNFDTGLSYLQQALEANVKNFKSSGVQHNPSIDNFYNGRVFLYTLLYKSEALEKRYLQKTLRFKDLTTSLKTLQLCDTLLDNLRRQSTNENDKIALGVVANDLYVDGVRIANEAALNALKKQPFRELAFYFAEKSKSAVLLEAISDANAKAFSGIPAELMEEEKIIKAEIALAAQKLSEKPEQVEEKLLREKLYDLNRRYSTFTSTLEKQYPQYFNLKFNTASPSIRQIQQGLDGATAVLSYFIDERNSRLYTFVITRNKFKVHERSVFKEFDRYLTGLRNSIFFNEINSYKLTATKLSELLIPSGIPGSIRHLVILPTGRTSIIPFETLPTKTIHKSTDYRNLPYLLKKYSVRYEFSASLLIQKKQKQFEDGSQSIFLCAPVTFPEKDGLVELPGTESEVKDIGNLFSSNAKQVSLNLHEAADESSVKENSLAKYKYIHFATHGVVDEKNPELSRIFLQTSESKTEDGNLFSGEIYNLSLDADLVTLSACQTGLGKISKGEGVIGLSRALVYAGAKML
jgi:CHAT domain-containing protein/Tfp pilus assembly protein PilF